MLVRPLFSSYLPTIKAFLKARVSANMGLVVDRPFGVQSPAQSQAQPQYATNNLDLDRPNSVTPVDARPETTTRTKPRPRPKGRAAEKPLPAPGTPFAPGTEAQDVSEAYGARNAQMIPRQWQEAVAAWSRGPLSVESRPGLQMGQMQTLVAFRWFKHLPSLQLVTGLSVNA